MQQTNSRQIILTTPGSPLAAFLCAVLLLHTASCGLERDNPYDQKRTSTAGGKTCKLIMCESDSDCDPQIWQAGCDTSTNLCRSCSKDSHCKLSTLNLGTGRCDTSRGNCYRCSTDAECAAGSDTFKLCGSDQSCVSCRTNDDCAYGKECRAGYCYLTTCDSSSCTSPLKCDNNKCVCDSAADCSAAYGSGYLIKRWDCR